MRTYARFAIVTCLTATGVVRMMILLIIFGYIPPLKRGGRRQDRATRFAIVSKCALRGSRRSPFSIFQFRRDWIALVACKLWMTVWVRFWKNPAKRAYTNSKSLCSLMQAPQTTTRAWEYFLSDPTSKENAEGGRKRKGEFVSAGNLTKASKITKGVRR